MRGEVIRPTHWPQPWPPGWPPGSLPPTDCGCGSQSPCDCHTPGWGDSLMKCWDDIATLKKIIAEIIAEGGGQIQTGPIQGVVNGQPAAPGDVGEFLQFPNTLNFSVPNGQTVTQTVSAAVIPPGDWDVMAQAEFNVAFSAIWFQCTPQPAGMQPAQFAAMEVGGALTEMDVDTSLFSGRVQLLNSVPTLLPYSISVLNNTGASTSGVVGFNVTARRMR